MAADDDKIKFSDLIAQDDTINYMILQLDDLNKSFGTVVTAIRAGAIKITNALKNISGATSEGKQAIDDAAIAASRLERAQKELTFAMTDTGKQVAWLKEQTKDYNASSVNQKKIITSLEGSYNKLKAELKDNVDLWKSLSEDERNNAAIGGETLNKILDIKQRLGDLNEQMKLQVTQMSELEKAQQRLTYLRSEDGKKLIEVKRQIADLLRGEREENQTIDQLTQAKQKLEQARSEENQELQKVNAEIRQANQLAKLQAQLNNSSVGSYNQLAAQYEINKIKLNAMGQQQRATTAEGKKLEEETLAIYRQMVHLQEATGNYRLSVGHYEKAWNGLGNAMNQIIRETPSMAVSLNTFFLAISNNLPILWDEIDRTREKNKLLRAEGKPTQSVAKTIVSSIFSWQTALIFLISALSANGKEIIQWVSKVFKGKVAIESMNDSMKNIAKELENTNASYGENVATVKKLADEWSKLSSKKEQLQWIKDNQTEFNKLDVSIRNINEAENAFAENTEAMITALKLRAKAAAATKLASEEYEKSLKKNIEAEQAEYDYVTVTDSSGKRSVKKLKKSRKVSNKTPAISKVGAAAYATPGAAAGAVSLQGKSLRQAYEEEVAIKVKGLKDEANAAEALGDRYVDLANDAERAAKETLKAAGIDTAHKKGKTGRTPHERDLTDVIFRNDLTIQKKYEASITALQRDEFKKRKNEAIDSAEATIRELQEKFRKNEVFLTGKKGNKPLTEEQKQQVENQQKEIAATIENIQRKLSIDLQDLEDERQIDSMTKLRQTMQFRYDTIAKEIKKEKELKLEQLDFREAAYTTKASTVNDGEATVTGQATPEQIATWHKQRAQIEAKYDQIILDLRAKEIQERLYLVKKGTKEERQLLLEQIETARKLALIQNRAKPIEQQESESSINARFGKQKLEVSGNLSLRNFQQQQALSKSEFDLSKHTADEIKEYEIKAEIALWKEKIRLAKSGSLDWSQAQIDEAHNVVAKLEKDLGELQTSSLSLIGRIGKYGTTGFLLSYMGFDDKGIQAWNDACSQILGNLQEIAQAEVDVAQAAVEAAEKRVEAAQSAYDAEVEGRNNGYANQVATKKKELQQEKKNQLEKQKLLEQAQKRQEAINTVVQASSLITASANIWSSMSSIPIVGPALALAAIATMWTSFAVAKVKAKQATAAANQEYGEGGLEFLEGGSHASGNDIDLHQKNSRGKNMRAEGGEAMAIINKRNTRKYKRVLPNIISSLNKGTFEEKFTNAFANGETIQNKFIQTESKADLTRLENGVEAIRKQNSEHVYPLGNGRTLIIKGNVRRYINN